VTDPLSHTEHPLGRRNFLAGAAAAGAAAAAATGVGLAATTTTASAQSGDGDDKSREFDDRCAFITGGARGIGLGTAKALAESGADIVLFDVAEQIDLVNYPLATKEDLEAARKEIEDLGVNCLAIQGDVRDSTAQEEAMAKAVSEFGSLDFLIVNAGITQLGPLDMLSDDEIDLVLDINLAGAMKTVRAAVPIMREQNSGRMVLLSSVTGRGGTSLFPVYSASKWGIIGLTKGTAQLMGPHNVTVNAVCPDIVRTGLLDNDYILGAFSPDDPQWDTVDAIAAQGHPLPVGSLDPIDIGELIRLICSDDAKYVSGDVFDIQGGANFQNLG